MTSTESAAFLAAKQGFQAHEAGKPKEPPAILGNVSRELWLKGYTLAEKGQHYVDVAKQRIIPRSAKW